MAPEGPVVAAVLVAALLHAGWNALIRGGGDKTLDTVLLHSLSVVLAIPVVAWRGFAPAAAWPFLIGSTLIHLAYFAALIGAYRHGELGLTYPIMRGTAPLLVATSSAAVIGEALSAMAWSGVLAVSLGVAAVGLSPGATGGAHHGKALRYALANAVIIASYTVVDGLGARASGDALGYVASLALLDGPPFLLLVLWRRAGRIGEAWRYAARRWPVSLGGAFAALGAYAIALWAMTRASVAVVAALRETSVLFAAAIGALWLKEGFGPRRAVGTLLIVAGVMALRLG